MLCASPKYSIAFGTSGLAVATKVTPFPDTPAPVAVSVYSPAPVDSVQLPTVATPDAFVVCVAPVKVPGPPGIAKVTDTPETGLPLASFTITLGGGATALLTVACGV